MKIFCLGGAGRICRETALDRVQFSSCSRITIGDQDEEAGRQVVQWLNDPRVDYARNPHAGRGSYTLDHFRRTATPRIAHP